MPRGVDGAASLDDAFPPVTRVRGARERVHHEHEIVACRRDRAFESIVHVYRFYMRTAFEPDIVKDDRFIAHRPRAVGAGELCRDILTRRHA